jgi:hypothetical protein
MLDLSERIEEEIAMRGLGWLALGTMIWAGAALAESPGASGPDALLNLLNQFWAPSKLDEQRWHAVSIGARGLLSLGAPTVAVRFSTRSLSGAMITELKPLLEQELKKSEYGKQISLRNVSIEAQDQELRLVAAVTYEDSEITFDADVVGDIAAAVQGDDLLLLPSIETAVVQKAGLRHLGANLAIAVPVANALLSQAVKRFNATLSGDAGVKRVHIALKPIEKIDLAARLEAIPGVSQVSGPTVDPNVHFENPVILIDPEAVEVLARLAPGPSPSPPASQSAAADGAPVPAAAEIAAAYQSFAVDFRTARDKLAKPAADPVVWAAIDSHFLAGLVTDQLGKITPPACATYNVSIPAPFDVHINAFDGGLPDCSPHFNCDLKVDSRDCRGPCPHNHDTRECNECLVSAFGRCQVRGNNPACEAAKAGQNAIYDTNYEACTKACEAAKAAQNALYAKDKFGCETNKTALKGQCEALKALEKQGQDLAEVSGQMQISGPARVCVGGLTLTPGLDQLSIAVTAEASLSINGTMHYIPHGVVGHLLGCVGEWKKPFSATVSAATAGNSLTTHLTAKEEEGALALKLSADDIGLSAEMHPGPFEAIFQEHPELIVECPITFVAGGIAKLVNAASVAASGNDLIPELRGHFRHNAKLPVQEIRLPPQIIALGAGVRVVASPHLETNAVVFTGVVQP